MYREHEIILVIILMARNSVSNNVNLNTQVVQIRIDNIKKYHRFEPIKKVLINK